MKYETQDLPRKYESDRQAMSWLLMVIGVVIAGIATWNFIGIAALPSCLIVRSRTDREGQRCQPNDAAQSQLDKHALLVQFTGTSDRRQQSKRIHYHC